MPLGCNFKISSIVISSSIARGMNDKFLGAATTLKGGEIVERSCTPIEALFRPLPNAKCNFSWWSINRLIISSSISTPLTTAPSITGLIFANSGETVIDIVPGLTASLGLDGESCKNGIIPWNRVSGDSRSGLSGKISISSFSSSQLSMSVPMRGSRNARSSMSCFLPFASTKFRSMDCSTLIVGILSPCEPVW